MDPVRQLLEFLQQQLSGRLADTEITALEDAISQLFGRFELVSKRDYAAHTELLATLEAQVSDLETRLNNLENR